MRIAGLTFPISKQKCSKPHFSQSFATSLGGALPAWFHTLPKSYLCVRARVPGTPNASVSPLGILPTLNNGSTLFHLQTLPKAGV